MNKLHLINLFILTIFKGGSCYGRKKLDSILNDFYPKCYESALDLFQRCSDEEIIYLGLLKNADYRSFLDDYDNENFTSEDTFDLVLDKSATDAFTAAACTILNGLQDNQNQSIN